MALTRDFKETVKERAEKDVEFRVGLLTEAAECLINGDVETTKILLRDYINATIGFQELGRLTGKKPQSLMRMLSQNGNPRADNLGQMMSVLREHEGISLHVAAE